MSIHMTAFFYKPVIEAILRLFEYYITGDDGGQALDPTARMAAQTFTPQQQHIVNKVKLLMYRVGSPGTVRVAIRVTDAQGKPDDDVEELSGGFFDGNELTTNTDGEWKEIEVTPNVDYHNLLANTLYAIEVEGEGATSGNYVVWRYDGSSPIYANGKFGTSTDGGTTWTMDATKDAMFEEWGYKV